MNEGPTAGDAAYDASEPGAAELTADEKTMAMLCHFLAFSGYVIPFGHIIGPAVFWSIKKEESSFVDYHGKECVNFQISLTIYIIVSIPLILVIVGILTLIALPIFSIACTIIAGVKASNGEYYRYPLSIRFVK